jgi:hypothetical protein
LRTDSGTALVLALAIAAVVDSGVSAHRRDELLQAARIAIEPSRIELALDLTPGIEVADAIITDMDRDRDGTVSADEQQGYVGRVLAAIELELDGQPLQVEPVAATFPHLDAFRRGEGTVHLQSAITLPRVPDGGHQLSFRNAYRRDVSVYLANALVPESDRVAVRAQRRDGEQRDLTIDYVVRGPASSTLVWLLSGMAGASVLAVLLAIFANNPWKED